MNTQHASERIAERLEPGASWTIARAIETLARTVCHPDKSYAVMVYRDTANHGTFTINPDGTGPSNGTDLWAIIRNRTVVTVMWRRTAQPVNPAAFGVDTIRRVALARP